MITASSNKMRNIPVTWLLTSSASRYGGSAIAKPKEMKKKTRHFIFLQRNVVRSSEWLMQDFKYCGKKARVTAQDMLNCDPRLQTCFIAGAGHRLFNSLV